MKLKRFREARQCQPVLADQGKELLFPDLSDDHFKITDHIMPSFLKLTRLPTAFVIKSKEWREKRKERGPVNAGV